MAPSTPSRPDDVPQDDARRRRLARVAVAGWVAACAAVVVVASLAPSRFDFSPGGLRGQWRHFLDSFRGLPSLGEWHEQRDFVTNILLYMPLGFLAPWWPSGAERFWRRLERCLLLLAGPVLSLSMELSQILTSDRDPNAWDWAANSAGYLAGYAVAWSVIAAFHLNALAFLGERGDVSRTAWAKALRLFYVLFFMTCALMPMDLSVSLTMVWSKLHAMGGAPALRLSPLAPWDAGRVEALALTWSMLVPFGFLSALSTPGGGGRHRLSLARHALAGGAWAALAEACRVCVASRSSDVLGVFAGAAGGVAGALLAAAWERSAATARRANDGTGADGNAADGPIGGPTARGADGLLLATIAFAAFLWAQGWWPYRFQPSPGAAWHKLRYEANWLPLRDYVSKRSVAYFADAAREILWWAPLGMLLGAWLGRVLRARGWRHPLTQLALALTMAGAWGCFVEFGQCLTLDRYVDVTDAMSHLVGILAGWLLARLLLGPARETF